MGDQPPLTRRAFLKSFMLSLGIGASVPSVAAYSRYIEPGWLKINPVELSFPQLPSAFKGMRIVQFSDVHLGFHFTAAQLGELIQRIEALHPDMICFTGDLYDSVVGADSSDCASLLGSLSAPLGKWAVVGNHDYYDDVEAVSACLTDGGFRVLMNENVLLRRGSQVIRIAGVDDAWEGKPDLKRALGGTNDNPFTILLAHAPDYADEVVKYPVHLQLSGHSHGGQVRLPFLGHLKAPPFGEKYVDGLYRLGGDKLKLYTNRGIGVSLYPVRFWCRPELTVFTLK